MSRSAKRHPARGRPLQQLDRVAEPAVLDVEGRAAASRRQTRIGAMSCSGSPTRRRSHHSTTALPARACHGHDPATRRPASADGQVRPPRRRRSSSSGSEVGGVERAVAVHHRDVLGAWRPRGRRARRRRTRGVARRPPWRRAPARPRRCRRVEPLSTTITAQPDRELGAAASGSAGASSRHGSTTSQVGRHVGHGFNVGSRNSRAGPEILTESVTVCVLAPGSPVGRRPGPYPWATMTETGGADRLALAPFAGLAFGVAAGRCGDGGPGAHGLARARQPLPAAARATGTRGSVRARCPALLVGVAAVAWARPSWPSGCGGAALLLASYAGGLAWMAGLAFVDGTGGVGDDPRHALRVPPHRRATSRPPRGTARLVARIRFDGLPDNIPTPTGRCTWPATRPAR